MTCMSFGMDRDSVNLCPNPAFRPKVITSSFRSRVVYARLHLLCPVRALSCQSLCRSDKLFVCYGGRSAGMALSAQRLSHWICNAIVRAYEVRGIDPPGELKCK